MFLPTIIESIIEEFPKKAIKYQLAFACTHCNSTGLDTETRQTCNDCNGMGVCEWRNNGMAEWLRPMIENLYKEARREALKEMDGAWDFVTRNNPEDCDMRDPVSVLRQEYQTN